MTTSRRNRRQRGRGSGGRKRARDIDRASQGQLQSELGRLPRRGEAEAVTRHRDADADSGLAGALDPLDGAAADAEPFGRTLDPTRLDVLAARGRAGGELAQERQWRQPLAQLAGVTPSRSTMKISVALPGIGGLPVAP